jgi:hypothetical protein
MLKVPKREPGEKNQFFLSIDLGQNKKIAGGCYWAHVYTYNVFFEKF